ncbi:MAG: 16S rRNA (uracil(1498)-N(3))-methyltransferase [Desulfobacteraceae bacterium]
MQKFFISDTDSLDNTTIISGQDAKHISKVLRMKPGDMIDLTDGQGTDFKGEILEISKQAVKVMIRETAGSSTESPLSITVFQGMLKDRKMDTLVRHLTELGISDWIPLKCERAVAVPNAEKAAGRIRRWETISREALKQCRRSMAPEIGSPVSINEMAESAADFDLKIVFQENASSSSPELEEFKHLNIRKIAVMIGPEGGFSDNEIETVQKLGFRPYLMGPRILRAETAATAACTLIQHIFGDL